MPRDEIDILAKDKVLSPIGGAQYLHENVIQDDAMEARPMPDVVLPHVHLGSAAGYAFKVYGDCGESTSWSDHDGNVEAWSLKRIYKQLWNRWFDRIEAQYIVPAALEGIRSKYPAGVISTIPATFTCRMNDAKHDFPTIESVLVRMPIDLIVKNVVIYSGRLTDPWYRLSNIDGMTWGEFRPNKVVESYPHGIKESIVAQKPMGTNCDCCSELGIVRMGRFGLWDRQVLLHHVPVQVENAVCAKLVHA